MSQQKYVPAPYKNTSQTSYKIHNVCLFFVIIGSLTFATLSVNDIFNFKETQYFTIHDVFTLYIIGLFLYISTPIVYLIQQMIYFNETYLSFGNPLSLIVNKYFKFSCGLLCTIIVYCAIVMLLLITYEPKFNILWFLVNYMMFLIVFFIITWRLRYDSEDIDLNT
jgi:hypothetical protein